MLQRIKIDIFIINLDYTYHCRQWDSKVLKKNLFIAASASSRMKTDGPNSRWKGGTHFCHSHCLIRCNLTNFFPMLEVRNTYIPTDTIQPFSIVLVLVTPRHTPRNRFSSNRKEQADTGSRKRLCPPSGSNPGLFSSTSDHCEDGAPRQWKVL